MRAQLPAAVFADMLSGARRDGMQSTVVGMTVRQGDQVLLLQRKADDDFLPGLWQIPAGHVEAGESVLQAVAMELLEETGWTLREIIALIDTFDYQGEAGQRTRAWNFQVTARISATIVHQEHQAHAWVGAEDCERFPMTGEMRRTVSRVLGRPT